MNAMNALEMNLILEKLAGYALSEAGKARARALTPEDNMTLIEVAARETADARTLIEQAGEPPLSLMEGLDEAVTLSQIEGLLSPAQLAGVAVFLESCRRMANYLKKGELMRVELSLNGRAFHALSRIQDEIECAIRGDAVADNASAALGNIRRKREKAHGDVRAKLQAALRAHPDWFADGYISERAGRQTLPVRAQYLSQVKGTVIDRSQTGATLFVEPVAARAAQEELARLEIEEENEVRRILYGLTALVADDAEAIRADMRLMEKLDFAFAKARLALEMRANAAEVGLDGPLIIREGRHPLLPAERAVPLDFRLEAPNRGIVVTGPNTGGKTVALKTVGLFTLMAQCGLQIPCAAGSRLVARSRVLTDIGDGQSIQENLSTFSAHMTRVLDILNSATRESLVLIDELGSGTDPAEGMGLAVAVLEELLRRGCLFVVTTHYPEIKEFARRAPGVQNARMAFDPATLRPLYRMEIGAAGESCALHIARRLGFPEALIERAARAAYQGDLDAHEGPAATNASGPRLTAYEKPRALSERAKQFGRGDSVRVYPEGQLGIVCQPCDERGMVCVQQRGTKRMVPFKRLKVLTKAEMLYPDDYDFSVIFDTVENRKARHVMGKRHDPDAVVRVQPEP